MKIYLAGPMRGLPEFNFPAFDAATDTLRAMGHEVFNPAERDRSSGFDVAGMSGHENLAELGFSLREALAADTEYISKSAEAIALLPGWERSSGVAAEVALANALGLPVAPYESFDEAGPAKPIAAELPASGAIAKGEVRTTSVTGGQKGTKPERYDLLPIGALSTVAALYGRGAEKYAAHNWRRGYEWSKSYAALQRHATQFWNGEDHDPEMQLPHMASVAFHALALLTFMEEQPQFDDRFKR